MPGINNTGLKSSERFLTTTDRRCGLPAFSTILCQIKNQSRRRLASQFNRQQSRCCLKKTGRIAVRRTALRLIAERLSQILRCPAHAPVGCCIQPNTVAMGITCQPAILAVGKHKTGFNSCQGQTIGRLRVRIAMPAHINCF